MDAVFVQLVQTITAKHGKESLFDSSRFRSRLPKNAESRFKKERHVLYVAIDMQAPEEIDAANELSTAKQALIDRMRGEFYIDEYLAKETIDLLALVLRGDRSLQITSAPSNGYNSSFGATAQGAKRSGSPTKWKKLWIAIGVLVLLLILIFFALRNTDERAPQEAPIDNEAKVILI
ncbi:MAG: hypothetical protein LBP89_00490 [Helicobacteraceae bacterium]|jgi:hypothetical protein|nr:hypothetical protein [Helicobacteraceae bacterium]